MSVACSNIYIYASNFCNISSLVYFRKLLLEFIKGHVIHGIRTGEVINDDGIFDKNGKNRTYEFKQKSEFCHKCTGGLQWKQTQRNEVGHGNKERTWGMGAHGLSLLAKYIVWDLGTARLACQL